MLFISWPLFVWTQADLSIRSTEPCTGFSKNSWRHVSAEKRMGAVPEVKSPTPPPSVPKIGRKPMCTAVRIGASGRSMYLDLGRHRPQL
jgi:hypothetical protein